MRLGADGLEFQLLCWVNNRARVPARSDVNLAVLRRLRAAGIDIPYPQRVVHVVGAGGQELTSPGG